MALLRPPVGPRDHTLGTVEAPVTLVEYGDFECPFCGRAYPELKQVLRQVGGKVQFVFRHFPLSEEHPHAQHAAEVAEAAAAQGKFWEMHDLLYQRQAALADEDLVRYARELGLDAERVRRELVAHVHAARVREDFESGTKSGVSGTPRFFINGRRHDEPGDAKTLAAALRRALERGATAMARYDEVAEERAAALAAVPGRRRGRPREHGRGVRRPDTARRRRADPPHARCDTKEDLRVEDRLLGRPGIRLALRSDAARDESRDSLDRRRKTRSAVSGASSSS